MKPDKNGERFRILEDAYNEGILIVMHPSPEWGQLDPDKDGLQELADWLIEEDKRGWEDFKEKLAGACPNCGDKVPGMDGIVLSNKFKCLQCLERLDSK